MDNARLALQAAANFHHLRENPYPGRGIVVGLNGTGHSLVQIYWIMGRSPNSRNRVFEMGGGHVYTTPADPSKVKDPSLIIYNAMSEYGDVCVVSNGAQTDTIIERLREPAPFECLYTGLEGVEYEPDAPNFTPRISAACGWSDDCGDVFYFAEMSVLRKSAYTDDCDHLFYGFGAFGPGFGHCITTYMGDGDPLPAFRGEPILVPLTGDIEDVADTYWAALNEDNKVSLVVKFIPKDDVPFVTIRNKYSKVGA